MHRLRDQIAANGLINPITVRPRDDGYTLIAGRNRLHACRLLGWGTIPATITNVTDHQAATIRLAENVTRSNLSPIEEAVQLADLIEDNPDGVEGVASTLGRPTAWVLNRLDLLTWDDSIQQAVHARKLSLGAASKLARIPDPSTRAYYTEQAILHGITARTAALWLHDALNAPAPDDEVSEKSSAARLPESPGALLQYCFLCQSPHEITTTTIARLCPSCAQAMHNASIQNAQPQESQPPQPPPTPWPNS